MERTNERDEERNVHDGMDGAVHGGGLIFCLDVREEEGRVGEGGGKS